MVILLVYVEYIMLTGNRLDEINNIKNFIKTKFLIKELGVLKFFRY